jgi:hypothetical protein
MFSGLGIDRRVRYYELICQKQGAALALKYGRAAWHKPVLIISIRPPFVVHVIEAAIGACLVNSPAVRASHFFISNNPRHKVTLSNLRANMQFASEMHVTFGPALAPPFVLGMQIVRGSLRLDYHRCKSQIPGTA